MFATKETDPTRQAPSQPPPSRELPLDRAPLDETPFDQTPFDRVPLDGVPFDGVPFDEVSLDEVPLDEVPLDEVPLDEVPFDGVPFDGVPFDGVPLDEVPLDEVPLDEVPLERIEVELIGWAGRLAAATARWLTWLAAYDRREGWGQWGCRSCAHWLSWKCGMSLRTGRDHVRVARSLESRPAVAMAFERGELSFSKVRALTRLAEPVDDDAMVDLARTATASQLDRLIAGCQQALTTGPESDELTTGWMTRSYRSQGRADGMVAITLLVTPDDAERIERAVEQRTDHLVAEATAGTAGTGDTADNAPGSVQEWVKERGGWSSVRADAAVELLTGLGDREDPDPAELAIEVDITALASGDGSGGHSSTAGHWLSHEVIRRYGCDGIARVIATDGDHQPLGVGRRQRIVPRWLRRRLERRDHHHCQFPGCDTTRRLHAHHIVHWADGGPTTLENLLLLCSFHHHVIHDRDWAISGTAPDHQITTPDGMPTTVPCLTGDPTTVANLDIGDPASLTASWAGERLDLAFAVEALIDHLKGTP